MLTDIAIRKAKPGVRLVKLSDSGGLQFWITPSGGKLWYLAYRFGGRQKKLAIGAYGAAPAGVTLEAARARRDEAKALLRQGIDPAAHKRRVKAAQAESLANTFEAVADELLARKKRDGVTLVTASKLEWLLGMAKRSLGSLPIDSIMRRAPAIQQHRRQTQQHGRSATNRYRPRGAVRLGARGPAVKHAWNDKGASVMVSQCFTWGVSLAWGESHCFTWSHRSLVRGSAAASFKVRRFPITSPSVRY
jgi:hypothetical protein